MALTFSSISTFRNSLASICKKPGNGYTSCQEDICNLLSSLSFADIWEMNFRVKDLDNIRIIKLRVQNSNQNLSSSDGFRLIICCNKKYESITFLNVYPKRGKLGMLDQPQGEFKRQLKEYAEQFKNGSLLYHDIKNKLVLIAAPK